ncbi:condensation domain-containing protein [Vibrio rhizosphaerae]|uniref:Condensation domain-containing protein n=1 Tax=Vibrio rhizosphaerae TaxID=398736 RepID=A0ABU4ITA9_9VIBR|nr:condensation domain-containing protein [Vibrio rhizosphaerae]MDW6092183.1 condensation domain-containing protein [Vibrio rhizosphaerae]
MSHAELNQQNSPESNPRGGQQPAKPENPLDPYHIAQRLAQLPAEKKQQFRALLQSKQIDSWQLPIVPGAHPDNRAVLSSAQQRLWFIEQYEQGRALYNLTGRLVLTGALDLQAMQRAFAGLLQRHHILRSTYQTDAAGQVYQQVEQDYPLPFEIYTRVTDIEQRCEQISNQPFALDRDLPVRVALLSSVGEASAEEDSEASEKRLSPQARSSERKAELKVSVPARGAADASQGRLSPQEGHQRWHLLFVIHHIAFDAWSESLLIQELAELYDHHLMHPDEEAIRPLPLQYADYALWQQEWLTSDKAQQQREFWQTTLANAPGQIQLPFDFPYPSVAQRNYQGAQERLTLPDDVFQAAQHFAAREGTTLYNVMQAAFLLQLNRQGAGTDICLGTSVANRQRPELENMLGFLVNTLVLRHQLPSQVTFRRLVSQVSQTTQAAFEHQDLPFDLVLDALNIERGQAWSPLFQVLFVYRNVPCSSLALTDVSVDVAERDLKQARFDMTVRLNEIDQADGESALRIDLEYSTELFRQETIQAFLQTYLQTLTQVFGQPDQLWDIREREPAEPMHADDTGADTLSFTDSDEVMQLAGQIAAGYREMLRKDVTLHDSFFQLGGDSILCLQLVALLKKSGIRLTPKQVFAQQTPLKIAREQLQAASSDTDDVLRLAAQIAAGYGTLLNKTVALDDSFFRQGGDSILCLQLVALLKKSDIRLTPKQVFALQTPIALARELTGCKPAVHTESTVQRSSDIPLAPIQHWFFTQHLAQANHWNQSVLLSYTDTLDLPCLRQAVSQVFALHPQLSARYFIADEVSAVDDVITGTDALTDVSTGSDAVTGTDTQTANAHAEKQTVLQQLGEGLLGEEKWPVEAHVIPAQQLNRLLSAQQSLLDLQKTAPIRVDVIDFHDQDGGRILLTAHHLVVDGVSWRVLLSQLCQAYFSLSGGEQPELTAPSASYGEWVNYLQQWPESRKRAARQYWQPLAGTDAATQHRWVRLPASLGEIDFTQPNRLADTDTLEVQLEPALTQKLTTTALQAYELGINDLLLAALNGVFATWRKEPELLIELEGHGRQHEALDLSQTVGWFTSRYPVRLQCHAQITTETDVTPGTDASVAGTDGLGNGVAWTDATMRQLILDTKAQLRQVPDQGQGFGVLKYLGGELDALVTPSVVFNYLGQLDRGLAIGDISLADETVPEQRHGSNRRKQWLDINAMIQHSALTLRWQFNCNVQTSAMIRQVAQDFISLLSALIEHCERAPSVRSLSDYPLIMDVVPSQAAFENLLEQLPIAPDALDNLYPLTPTQQGMLFHSLAEPNQGLYLNQSIIDFHGELDVQALQHAWQALFDHHPVLRSGFIWQGLDVPLQYVAKTVPLDWQVITGDDDTASGQQVHQLAQAAFKQEFTLTHPGLMRFRLVRLKADHHCLIWTRHHLIVDGWCTGQMVAEVRRSYQSLTAGRGAADSVSVGAFADFVAWLKQQDTTASLDYWQQLLTTTNATDGVRLPRPLKPVQGQSEQGQASMRTAGSSVRPSVVQQYTQTLSPASTAGLKALAAKHQLTLNSLCQAVWALILKRYTNHDTVTMGITSAGRPDALDNAQQMMGVFITTIPLVAQLNQSQSLVMLAHRLQNQLINSREHEHVPLVEIQKATGLTDALFDNLLVFENYPGEQFQMDDALQFTVRETLERNNYPLTLVLVPHQQLDMRLTLDSSQIEPLVATAMLADFVTLLTQAACAGDEIHEDELIRALVNESQQTGPWLWNQTEQVYDVPATLDAYLARQVEQTPERIALVCPADMCPADRGTSFDLDALSPEARCSDDNEWQPGQDFALSYQMLDALATRFAHSLRRSHQCMRGERIGLCMRRSPEMVIAILACVKLGCAYVPLDPDLPAQRLAMIVASARPKVVLAQQGVMHLFDEFKDEFEGQTPEGEAPLAGQTPESAASAYPPIMVLGVETAIAKSQIYHGQPWQPADSQIVQPDDILYVLYTSGSTGQPKGVAVPHAGIVNRIAWMQDTFGLQHDDAVLQKTPYGFDVSVWEFFWPLVSGARLVMAEPDAHKDSGRLSELVRDYGITTMHFVPAMLHGFLESFTENSLAGQTPESAAVLAGQTPEDAASFSGQTPQAASSPVISQPVTSQSMPAQQTASPHPQLRRLICSGEALPYHVQQHCLTLLPHVELYNLYGPTEASIDVTWWDCRAQNIVNEVPIGYPIANMQTWILDAQLNPVPVGVAGELYLAGVGLAAGYLGQPELTESVFIANPLAVNAAAAQPTSDAQYARLYRTGDLARYRADGAIEYLGRADFQVKIRGQRIELGEIEAVLATYPAIREAVVQVRARGQQDALVGYVVCDQQLPVEPLMTFLQQRLPAYMVPDQIEILSALPLTHNGKVDRKHLPEPGWQRVMFSAPQTPTEQQLAALWQTLLGIESVGRHDNFFALGGHSLLLTRLVNRINQQFNLNLRLAQLIELPDLASLAAYVDMNDHSRLAESATDHEDERESFEL